MTYTDPPTLPTIPPKRPSRRWVTPLACVTAAMFAITGGVIASSDGETNAPVAPAETMLKSAHDSCSAGVLSDGDRTMVLDMGGEEADSGYLSFDQVTCVLAYVGVPSSVTSRMDATRALDGVQDAEWKGFTATWTYHPDNGLDVILTEN
jgi:hypothetical protein